MTNSPSWLDFLDPHDRYQADSDPAYREALRHTFLGRICELKAEVARLKAALYAAFPTSGRAER